MGGLNDDIRGCDFSAGTLSEECLKMVVTSSEGTRLVLYISTHLPNLFFFLSWPVVAHAVKLLGTHSLETCFKGNFKCESHSLSGTTSTVTLSNTTWRRYCRGEPLLPHHGIPRYLVL